MNLDIKQALKMYNRSMLENSFGGILSNKSNLQEEFEYKMPNIADSKSQIYFNWSTNEA